MPAPLVTALIDTYNHERFIEQAIRSVLEQDFSQSELEIIVVDDGSTDGTAAILKNFAPRVRTIRKTNGGQASAFNASIPECRGEVICFLDGDDWWAPGKLAAVTNVFSREPSVGLVGHGISVVCSDGTREAESLRETTRFRVTSAETARHFRMCRGFLGTSRMSYRREVLGQIGHVPEELKFEADEYLFTVGSVVTDVVILRDALTFYRLHDSNLFQFTNGNADSVRKKQKVLSALAGALDETFWERQVEKDVAKTILECVEVEADLLRLMADGGFPWETVSTEARIMRIFHGDASAKQRLFSWARILPAMLMPAGAYYRWRHRVSSSGLYTKLRRRFLPFPVPKHVERRDDAGARGEG